MRTAVRRLLALGAIFAALLLGAANASAGGPTSVLISNPDTQNAAALYRSDGDYQALMDALEPADEPAVELGPGNIGPGSINITWLIHDVTVWRTDFVRLEADGRVLVQTNTATGGDGIGWEGGDDWHVAAAGAKSEDTKLDQTASVAAQSQDPAGEMLTGWWWLLPGAAVGLALGLGARPLSAELARRRELGPRHQLIG